MAERDCICLSKKAAPPTPCEYPTLTRLEDAKGLMDRNGYLVVRQLLAADEVDALCSEISSIIHEWYDASQRKESQDGQDWEEIVNRLPSWKEGRLQPETPEMGIRRLFRMAVHNELFARMARDDKIVSVVTQLLGEDVKLLQSMALLKPPGSGEKKWHQDNAYYRLSPCKIVGVWIALDPAYCGNGCMHMLPQSHGSGVYKHAAPLDFHIDYGMVDLPKADDVVPVVLNPGDALIFHGETAHYTPPNVSNARRRSLQFHYAACECKPTKCPRSEKLESSSNTTEPGSSDPKPHYFDCDPGCVEPQYWYYRKGELLVAGRDYGGDHI